VSKKQRTSEVFAIIALAGQHMVRCGGKVINAQAIDTFGPAKNFDGPACTVVHYEGVDGEAKSWVFYVPFEMVWDEWVAASEVISSNQVE